MSFLDNLENNLKALESIEERDGSAHEKREANRRKALEIAPWAERLKSSSYVSTLFDQAASAGHRLRAKVYMAWLETTLRLEVRDKKLELRPTPEGILAVFLENKVEIHSRPLDLERNPGHIITGWLV